VLYVCSAAARPVALRARDTLGASLAGRVEVRRLPPATGLAALVPGTAPSAAGEPGS